MDKDKKEKPTGKTAEEIFITAFILFIVVVFITRVFNYFSSANAEGSGFLAALENLTGGPNGWLATIVHYIQVGVSAYVMIATIFCIVTFLAILWVSWLTHELKVEEKKKMAEVPMVEDLPSLQSQKWEKIQGHVNSQNPAEWRLSILEADVMLDEMTKHIGFHGDTLGERLKNISKGDFKTLDIAWEAHKIRNAIAHEGSDFLLSQRESKRVIDLYEMVFKEFSYIN